MKCYFSSQHPNPWVALNYQLNRASVVHCDVSWWAYSEYLAIVESRGVGSFVYGPSIGPYLVTCELFSYPCVLLR
jgi:hypothetical protein